MKKATLILGIVSSFLFLVGITLKILHLPGAGPCLFLSVILFALGYSPLLLVDRNKITQDVNQKWVNMMSATVMSIVAITFLFKAMHWPGAGIGVYLGNILLLLMIPVLFLHAYKEKDEMKKMNFYNEAILMVVISGFSLFIWLITARPAV